jgi:hypothetical protein
VVKVNKSLDNLDLEFRHLLDESSGKEMYAVVGINVPHMDGCTSVEPSGKSERRRNSADSYRLHSGRNCVF